MFENARDQQRRRRILDAAEALVAAHGYDALTLDQVAHAAGMPVGSLLQVFVSTQDVLDASLRRHSEALHAVFALLPADISMFSPADIVNAMFARVVQLAVANAGLLVQVRHSEAGSALHAAAQVVRDQLREHLIQVIQARVPAMAEADCQLHAQVCQSAAGGVLGEALLALQAGERAHATRLLESARVMLVAYFEGVVKPFARTSRR